MTTIKINTPVEFNGKTYAEFTFRKPKAKDLVVADLVKGETRRGLAIMASMAGVPLPVFEELELEDFEAIGAEVASLMGKFQMTPSEQATGAA